MIIKHRLHPHATGEWLPKDHLLVREFIDDVISRSDAAQDKPYNRVVRKFKKFIDINPEINKLATAMFNEFPVTPPYNKNPMLQPQIRTYDQMFACLNIIIAEGPQWYLSTDMDAMSAIGCPISAMLEWPMGTKSGYEFFRRPDVNKHWKAILNKWSTFLSSDASAFCLNRFTGWTSPSALPLLADKGNCGTDHYTFSQLYDCDPSKPYHGFTSWDAFFTRRFRPDIRPVAYPEEPDKWNPWLTPSTQQDPLDIIVNTCESTPCNRQENVQLHDIYWAKSQPYSLSEMLNGEDKAKPFAGGQVYQAYLSALSYHRWHAPVSGRVVSVENVPGTYYSANFYEGFANVVDGVPKPDPSAPCNSQPYTAEVATRGIIHIEADDWKIGRMVIVFVGMCEVSSCEFFVKEGERVVKGQEIGTFRYGGSTHVVVFGPWAEVKFVDPGPYDGMGENKKVNSVLAVVS